MKNEISTLNPSQCCEKIFKENGKEYTLEHFHRVYTILEENYYDEDFVKDAMIVAKNYFKKSEMLGCKAQGYFAYLEGVIRNKNLPPVAQAFAKLVGYSKNLDPTREIALIEQDITDLFNELLNHCRDSKVCELVDDACKNFRQFCSFDDVKHYLIQQI